MLGSGSTGNRHVRRTPGPSPEPVVTQKHTSSPQRVRGNDREKAKARDRDLQKADSGKKRKAELKEAEETESLKEELEKTKRQQGATMTEPSKLLQSESRTRHSGGGCVPIFNHSL